MTIVQAIFSAILSRYMGKEFTKRVCPAALFSAFCVAPGLGLVLVFAGLRFPKEAEAKSQAV